MSEKVHHGRFPAFPAIVVAVLCAYLAISIVIDQDITRFDVSMNLSFGVQVLESIQGLLEHDGDLLFRQRALADGHQIAQRTGTAELREREERDGSTETTHKERTQS
jgi:hypothetical protein